MNTKFLYIISSIIVFIIMFNFNISYASDISDVFTGGDTFISAGQQSESKLDDDTLENTSDMIYNILVVLGMGIAVIISGILGIKFMMGSVEEKAQVKDQLIPFVIGCIVIFGAFSIWKIVVTFGRNVVPEPTTQSTPTTTSCPHCGSVINFQMINKGECRSCGGDL